MSRIILACIIFFLLGVFYEKITDYFSVNNRTSIDSTGEVTRDITDISRTNQSIGSRVAELQKQLEDSKRAGESHLGRIEIIINELRNTNRKFESELQTGRVPISERKEEK